MSKNNSLKEKSILYIVHNYTSFQKDQIEEVARYFKQVIVLVRYKPISNLANLWNSKALNKYREANCIDTHKIPNNVRVLKTPVLYLPYGFFYIIGGFCHFLSVLFVIKRFNLKFNIIHGHFLWSSGYVAMKLGKIFKKPVVVTGHGYDVYSLPFKNRTWRKYITNVVNGVDKVITISGSNTKYLKKLINEKNKLELVYNGFSPELFHPIGKKMVRKELSLDEKKRICVAVGNIIKIKGHKDLIYAINLLPKEYDDIELYIVGSGVLLGDLEDLTKGLGLKKRVHFVGVRPHWEIVKWMNSADLFVLSSLKEGAPVVALEALACGIPVIGTRVGIVPDIIKSDDYGYMCEVGNPQSLSEGIRKGFSKKWDKEKISKYGLNFTWSKATEKIINIYKDLLRS